MIIVALLVAACAPTAAPPTVAVPSTTPVAAQAAVVQPQQQSAARMYPGEVRSSSTLTIIPKGAGRVEKLLVDVGSPVNAGDPIAELDKDFARLTVKQQEAALTQARARLSTLKAGARPEVVAQAEAGARAAAASADAIAAPPRPESIAQAEIALDNARQRLTGVQSGRSEVAAQADAGVAAAQARLAALLKGPTPERIRAQEIAIEAARRQLEGAWVLRDGICFVPNPGCDSARAGVLTAEAAVRQAEQTLAILKAPAKPEAVAEAQAAVDGARQQAELARRPAGAQDIAALQAGVRAAEAGLQAALRPTLPGAVDAAVAQADAARAGAALAANPYTREDVALAESGVAQAEAALALAKSQLADLTVVSPVDGVVAEKMIVVGAVASPMTPIVSIVAPELEVSINVEETRLPQLQVGAPAQIRVAAYPGQTLNGKVKVVAPTVDARTRTALVRIQPDADATAKLKPGMFAQVSLGS